MKTKVALIIFILVSVGLGVALIFRNQEAAEQHTKDVEVSKDLSNRWSETSIKLEEERQVHLSLEKDVAARKADIANLSNVLAQTTETLTNTEASLKTSMEETAKRDTKIADLEKQNEVLDKQADDLKGSIGKLEGQISDTQKKLDASEGDKAFLEKELQRLMAEKAELERQFNDLAVMRSQVKKLKEELSISRRLEWIREGLFAAQDEKGAQKLMQGANAGPKPPPSTNYDLNVEVKSDGSVQVIAPITNNAASNAPPFDPMSPISK
jgi:chromosome segregation ATPase